MSRATVSAFALIGLLLALVLLLAGVSVWQAQRDARRAVEGRAVSAAYTASTHVRWLVEANLQALRRVAESMAGRPDLFAASTVKDLNEAVAALPGAVPIWVFDADGDSMLSNEAAGIQANVAQRDYFQALKAGAEWHIGPLLTGRVTGRKVFPIGYRIEREGRFLGAVVVYVPADLMAQFWASMDLGPGSTVGLLRDDGWLVTRYPIPERTLNLADYVLFTRYLPAAPEGFYEAAASPADGVSRIVGYRRVEGLPLVTVVGVPASSLADNLFRRTNEIALVAAPVGLALLLVSLWVVRLLHREEQARHALAGALEDNRTLFREIHHRVKNNLQTVAALVRLQPGPAEPKQELMRRITAMAAMHEHVYRSDRFDRLDASDYVRTLVEALRGAYGSEVEVSCALSPVMVSPDQALPLGLIVNEVVSNAFKHAFPDGRAGLIEVSLRNETAEADRAVLRVRDDGIGHSPEWTSGMGSRLIRALAQQIGGRHEFRNDGGTVFVLAFPLDPPSRGGAENRTGPGGA
ncbi:sensor histidine kinase [Arenibaculum sp.]|uniref:sensor histidine kinase n=1 Tax=Arenibaculum sp. TaxID=2865862 RepID=UPI002E0EE830|nr:histidine kinase dimerization/phosphoacceptor domain -containing protein [Arenibaculum sp.]